MRNILTWTLAIPVMVVMFPIWTIRDVSRAFMKGYRGYL